MQRETENQNNFSNVYTLLDLDEPSAKSIRDLDTIMGESQGRCAEQHQHALVTETLHQLSPTPQMGWQLHYSRLPCIRKPGHWAALQQFPVAAVRGLLNACTRCEEGAGLEWWVCLQQERSLRTGWARRPRPAQTI